MKTNHILIKAVQLFWDNLKYALVERKALFLKCFRPLVLVEFWGFYPELLNAVKTRSQRLQLSPNLVSFTAAAQHHAPHKIQRRIFHTRVSVLKTAVTTSMSRNVGATRRTSITEVKVLCSLELEKHNESVTVESIPSQHQLYWGRLAPGPIFWQSSPNWKLWAN